jgi:hypothetical protein
MASAKIVSARLDPDRTTVTQVRELLKKSARKGSFCPCCRQWVQVKPSDMTPGMVFVLLLVHRASLSKAGVSLHVPTLIREAEKVGAVFRPAGWQNLRFWGLLVPKPHPKHGHVGYFALTPAGCSFAQNQAKVKKSLLVYEGKRLGLDPESAEVGVEDVLAGAFSYADLFAGRIGLLP